MLLQRNWKSILLYTLIAGVSAWAAADPLILPPTVNTSAGPSTVFLDDTTYVFYKGANDDTRIFMTRSSSPLGSWTDAANLPLEINTSDAPSAVVQGPAIYVVYKGAWSDQGIYVARSIDGGFTWVMGKFPSTVNTSTGPNAYLYNGTLYVTYKGAWSDPRIYVAALPANTGWMIVGDINE